MKCILGMVALLLLAASCSNKKENTETSEELLEIIHRVNQRYQSMHKPQVRSFGTMLYIILEIWKFVH